MTKQEYNEYLRRIREANPEEPLLGKLRTGYSAINVIFMKSAMKRLPKVQEEKKEGRDEEEEIDSANNPVLKELWARKGQLFRQRAKWSNQFHECKTDAERRAVSDGIMKVWEDIQDIERKIAFVQRSGSLPEGEERFPLPDDPIALMKKLNSIRAQISQRQQKLRELAQLPNDDPSKAVKITQTEAELAELKLYRGHAEEKAGIYSRRLETSDTA